jgi:hypothetical protein
MSVYEGHKLPRDSRFWNAAACGGAVFVDTPHRIARLADHELWMVFLRDSDDHLLALMAERPLALYGGGQ